MIKRRRDVFKPPILSLAKEIDSIFYNHLPLSRDSLHCQ